MARYCFYVDGFNVYHALNDPYYYPQGEPHCPENRRYRYRKYKWLNFFELAKRAIKAKDTISGVFFFTTYAKWKWQRDAGIEARHKLYVTALRTARVEIIQGRFLQTHERCHTCGATYVDHHEKRTDVNIALKLLGDAIDDLYDRAVIISADSDLLPAIDMVHRYGPTKEVGVMFPIGRRSYDLKAKADFRLKMPERLIRESQFPDTFEVDGASFEKPTSWI